LFLYLSDPVYNQRNEEAPLFLSEIDHDDICEGQNHDIEVVDISDSYFVCDIPHEVPEDTVQGHPNNGTEGDEEVVVDEVDPELFEQDSVDRTSRAFDGTHQEDEQEVP
jgi:hypothetical protein